MNRFLGVTGLSCCEISFLSQSICVHLGRCSFYCIYKKKTLQAAIAFYKMSFSPIGFQASFQNLAWPKQHLAETETVPK